MAPDTESVSAYALAVAAAGTLAGPQAAALVGTYGLIFFGWFCGLLYGLYTRPVDSKLPAWVYSLVTLCLSLATTVWASDMLVKWSPWDVQWTAFLFPVAAAIPAFPDKWGTVGSYVLRMWEAARGAKQ